jgi:hypothetical protein
MFRAKHFAMPKIVAESIAESLFHCRTRCRILCFAESIAEQIAEFIAESVAEPLPNLYSLPNLLKNVSRETFCIELNLVKMFRAKHFCYFWLKI